MNDIWNEICFELRACIQNNVLEKDYENTFVNCMMLLGWKKFRGEIVTQYAIQAGHENKYADIVVLQNDVEQFVIEIKRPSHLLQEEDEKQLFSYMRLLKHQVPFGLYVGDKIRLYYDDITSQQLPEQVFSVDITEDNPEGIKFVELFSKDSFNAQVLFGFCRRQKDILQERRQIQEEVNKILSDTKGMMFKDLLREKYLGAGYSVEWIDTVLEQFSLSVSSMTNEHIEKINSQPVSACAALKNVSVHRDRTRYSLLGSAPLPKRKFVLEVVRHFVDNNPKTFNEYAAIFNKLRPDSYGVITALNSLSEKQLIRYFTDKTEYLKSTDGITFVVCNQWGRFNIEPIVQFANSQGYNVVAFDSDEE